MINCIKCFLKVNKYSTTEVSFAKLVSLLVCKVDQCMESRVLKSESHTKQDFWIVGITLSRILSILESKEIG